MDDDRNFKSDLGTSHRGRLHKIRRDNFKELTAQSLSSLLRNATENSLSRKENPKVFLKYVSSKLKTHRNIIPNLIKKAVLEPTAKQKKRSFLTNFNVVSGNTAQTGR